MRLLTFALFSLFCACSIYASDMRVVQLATDAVADINIDTTWFGAIREVDTSKPVQLVVYISTWTAGSIGIYLYGAPIDPSTAAWVPGEESLILLHSRTGIGSGGRYWLQLNPNMESNASGDLGFILPFVRAAVATDNAATTTFSAWLVYHVK